MVALIGKGHKSVRLAELSERSGVSAASIKHYLREGLLPPGRRVGTTTSDYDEGHVRRLRLIRALIQVGKVPVATVREVLRHMDDDSLGRTIRLGAGLWALAQEPEPDPEDEAVAIARREVDKLLEAEGWSAAQQLRPLSPSYRSLVAAVATLVRLEFPWDADHLVHYARLMRQVASRDLDFLETVPSESAKAETVVAAALLFEPVLKALHRLAQEEESARRYGI